MLFDGNSYATRPSDQIIEITVMGRGYGEAIVVHLGDGAWIVVDSCAANSPHTCAPLLYLTDLGFEPSNSVRCIVASHWDDDHVRGLGDMVEVCKAAKVVLSKAFRRDEFLAYVEKIDGYHTGGVRSGVGQLRQALRALSNQKVATGAEKNRCILASNDLRFSHGQASELWTLSPSDQEVDNFLMMIASEMPRVGETRRASVIRTRNDLSVVVWISVGGTKILLGGDLEEEGKSGTGWTAILDEAGRPSGEAEVFKIPHHGSITGHHDRVWNEILVDHPNALCAPWILGGSALPNRNDVVRILGRTPHAYSASQTQGRGRKRRPRAVERTIKETTRRITSLQSPLGLVRLRKPANSISPIWSIELFGPACHFNELYAAA